MFLEFCSVIQIRNQTSRELTQNIMTYLINSFNTLENQISSPLGLYFHFPYCSQRCPYCNFTLTTADIDHQNYLEASVLEFESRLYELMSLGWTPQPLQSIYVGGGTPGLWAPDKLKSFIDHVKSRLGFQDEIEITLEANPGEVTQDLTRAWFKIGINRLSLGAQSMRTHALQRLGRTHHPDDVKRTVTLARQSGIHRINIDLMHGMYGEGIEEALADLDEVIALSPSHISLYQLTIEPQTQFYARVQRGEQLLEHDDTLLSVYRALEQRLQQHHFTLYEVSNAALHGEVSKHNMLYWTMGQYLGIGVGAHGRVDLPYDKEGPRGLRWQNIKSTRVYLDRLSSSSGHAVIEEERQQLNAEALDEERVLVGLRLKQGLKITPRLELRFGEHAAKLVDQGLLEFTLPDSKAPWGRWKASETGRDLLNHVTTALILG